MKGNYVELTADFVYPYGNQSSEIQNSCCIMGALSEMVNALDALNFFSRGEGA
uniref:Uncharacterized protein n=1 Tax=Triticum urartu TaxID=4572 RepID=A0A8R7UKR2_TRIUA